MHTRKHDENEVFSLTRFVYEISASMWSDSLWQLAVKWTLNVYVAAETAKMKNDFKWKIYCY